MSMPTVTPDPRITALPAAKIRRRFVEFFAERGHTVVPSASLVPAGDQTLLFTNSGMVQFKDLLTGAEQRSYTRAVDYQRCLRVAGKHNDFEEVGRTPRHHTLFEMLGNWSFGDYFKREAIHWAWEFLTRDLGIPGDRLAATTYTTDDLAHEVWRDEIGLPADRLVRWGDFPNGDEKNWWRMADIGPSGPCSEIHFDRGADLSEGPECVPDHSEHCPRWLEIWNLVFMEFELHPDRSLTPLPAPGVDTGMGLERLASVLQQVPTNYDTDLFMPIHARMRELLGHDPDGFEAERFSYQVIADHSRAVTFLIADDVLPGNEGRGYVLRRILRRAVRHGRLLGRRERFMAQTAEVVIQVMGEAYPHLVERRAEILDVIAREEEQFNRSLDRGTARLGVAMERLAATAATDAATPPGAETFGFEGSPGRKGPSSSSVPAASDLTPMIGRRPDDLDRDALELPGDVAFELHDTFGFPIDLTIEMAAESGVRVDRAGFDAALAQQRERSRSGKRADLAKHAELTALYGAVQARAGDSAFLGYETTTAEGLIVAIIRDGMEFDELTGHGAAELVLDRTPFYAEGGGQVGDQGAIREPGGGSELFTVEDTQRPVGGLIVHRGTLHGRVRVGETVEAAVDADRRAHTMRNHTGTHLLHRALRNVVGDRARQAGSLVTPDYLRFDFPFDRALTDEEKRAIEDEVRAVVRDDRAVSIAFLPMAEAIAQGADAFFDEKYGETVRTIRVQDYSFELCGGTHCRASGQIGAFVITGERSIGSGMRRIEAVTGAAADALVRERLDALERIATTVGARSIDSIDERITALQEELRATKQRLKAGAASGLPRPAELAASAEEVAPGVRLVAAAVPYESMDALKAASKDVRATLGDGVIALLLDADAPQVWVTVSDDLVARGISAGDLVKVAAGPLGAKGGGRPQMAQGMGTRRDGIPDALAAIRAALSTGA
ncbi:MAG: alanine--tRNA ligase [Chloroflexota bacterium]